MLAESDLEGALVGGFAVSVRTEPRFTRDVDLVVAVSDDDQAERLVARFLQHHHQLLESVEQESAGRLATARIELQGGGMLDLLFASSGIEPEVVGAAEPTEVLPGLQVPVARVGHLVALKLLARDDVLRPQDAGDLRALLAVAGPTELQLAREAVELIEQRGFGRGRALVSDLDRAIEQAGS